MYPFMHAVHPYTRKTIYILLLIKELIIESFNIPVTLVLRLLPTINFCRDLASLHLRE